jgi:hypothetical protein
VIDIQDPWLSEYEGRAPGMKARLARLMHARLEPFTMKTVDGLVAVSSEYIATLRRRYPWIAEDACVTIPFGASADDFDAARQLAWTNPFFTSGEDGPANGVAVGRGGADMNTAARILFRASRQAASSSARFWFVGTDYAPKGRGSRTIQPVADAEGVGATVSESTDRVAYLQGLRLITDADFLVVLGSDDPQYSPSKVYPYLLAGRPVVSILHESSPVVDLMRRAGFGPVITFRSQAGIAEAARRLATEWPAFLATLSEPRVAPEVLTRTFSARELTRWQADLFARVLRLREAPLAEATCRG